jgi:hypothetical protein
MQDQQVSLRRRRARRSRRAGSVVVWCAFLLPVLVAMVGLTVDGGLMLAAYREAQNAADAGAMAAAMDLMLGKPIPTAQATGQAFVTDAQHNNLANATVVVNIPPSATNYAAYKNTHYAEAIVTYPITTRFLQVIPGFLPDSVTARAVAGFEPVAGGEGVQALSPTGVGLDIGGNAQLSVNGPAWINSSSSPAIKFDGSHSAIYAKEVDVVGNVANSQIFDYSTSQSMTPNTGAMPLPDYLSYLPTPDMSNGVVNQVQPVPPANGGTLQPGIYNGGISISGNGTYTLSPGIYVMQGGGFSVTGDAIVTGNGVMIYNTGNDYSPTSGAPDNADPIDPLNQSPPTVTKDGFGGLTLNQSVTLTPINDPSSPFNGMVFYQRRANTAGASLAGNSGSSQISGTFYGKWAQLNYAGNGATDAQFVFNTVKLTGNGVVTIGSVGQNVGSAPRVFLVE